MDFDHSFHRRVCTIVPLATKIVCFALTALGPTIPLAMATPPDNTLQQHPETYQPPSPPEDIPVPPPLNAEPAVSMAQVASICFGLPWEPNRFMLVGLPDDEATTLYLVDARASQETIGRATTFTTLVSGVPLASTANSLGANPR